jgi:F0F1-type ATP synthase membrane subunit b/b'
MAVDILHLIDRLEEEISQGRRLPLAGMVVLNEQRLWDIIDTMRISVPEEVQQAQQVNRDRERILAQVREEAGRIVDLARKQAEEITSDHEVIQGAQAEAEGIKAQAQREARQLQSEADAYALRVMEGLEEQLAQLLKVVRNGMALLSDDRAAMQASDDVATSRGDGSSPAKHVTERERQQRQ